MTNNLPIFQLAIFAVCTYNCTRYLHKAQINFSFITAGDRNRFLLRSPDYSRTGQFIYSVHWVCVIKMLLYSQYAFSLALGLFFYHETKPLSYTCNHDMVLQILSAARDHFAWHFERQIAVNWLLYDSTLADWSMGVLNEKMLCTQRHWVRAYSARVVQLDTYITGTVCGWTKLSAGSGQWQWAGGV